LRLACAILSRIVWCLLGCPRVSITAIAHHLRAATNKHGSGRVALKKASAVSNGKRRRFGIDERRAILHRRLSRPSLIGDQRFSRNGAPADQGDADDGVMRRRTERCCNHKRLHSSGCIFLCAALSAPCRTNCRARRGIAHNNAARRRRWLYLLRAWRTHARAVGSEATAGVAARQRKYGATARRAIVIVGLVIRHAQWKNVEERSGGDVADEGGLIWR